MRSSIRLNLRQFFAHPENIIVRQPCFSCLLQSVASSLAMLLQTFKRSYDQSRIESSAPVSCEWLPRQMRMHAKIQSICPSSLGLKTDRIILFFGNDPLTLPKQAHDFSLPPAKLSYQSPPGFLNFCPTQTL